MCSRYSANSNGRTIYAPGNVYVNELVRNGTLFNPIPVLDEFGGHISANPNICLDCGFKPRPQYSFKFACNTLRNAGGAGDCNCWDPASMAWQMGSMGVPQVPARFNTFN